MAPGTPRRKRRPAPVLLPSGRPGGRLKGGGGTAAGAAASTSAATAAASSASSPSSASASAVALTFPGDLGADPFSADPFSADPFSADPFSADPFSADPFSADPFSADPLPANPFPADPLPAEAFPAGVGNFPATSCGELASEQRPPAPLWRYPRTHSGWRSQRMWVVADGGGGEGGVIGGGAGGGSLERGWWLSTSPATLPFESSRDVERRPNESRPDDGEMSSSSPSASWLSTAGGAPCSMVGWVARETLEVPTASGGAMRGISRSADSRCGGCVPSAATPAPVEPAVAAAVSEGEGAVALAHPPPLPTTANDDVTAPSTVPAIPAAAAPSTALGGAVDTSTAPSPPVPAPTHPSGANDPAGASASGEDGFNFGDLRPRPVVDASGCVGAAVCEDEPVVEPTPDAPPEKAAAEPAAAAAAAATPVPDDVAPPLAVAPSRGVGDSSGGSGVMSPEVGEGSTVPPVIEQRPPRPVVREELW